MTESNTNVVPFAPRPRKRAGKPIQKRSAAPPSEEAVVLDRLLADPDPALLVSLANEDRRRRGRLCQHRRRRAARWAGIVAVVGLVGAGAGVRIARPTPAAAAREESAPSLRADELDRAGWLVARGNQLSDQARHAEAAAAYRLAADLDSNAVAAWNGLGWSLYRQGQRAESKTAFEHGLKLDHDHSAARRGLGNLAFAAGDYGAAATHWRLVRQDRHLAAALLLDGRFAHAAQVLADLRAGASEDELLRAMAHAASRERLDDELAWILVHRDLGATGDLRRARAWSAYYQQRNAEAARGFEALLMRDPHDTDASVGRGFALVELGRVGEARQHFEALLAQVPQHAAALNGLALCAREEGRLDMAIAGWEHLRQQDPDARSPAQQLPFAYLERGDHARALPGLLRLATHHPDDRRVLAGLRQALTGVVRARPDDA